MAAPSPERQEKLLSVARILYETLVTDKAGELCPLAYHFDQLEEDADWLIKHGCGNDGEYQKLRSNVVVLSEDKSARAAFILYLLGAAEKDVHVLGFNGSSAIVEKRLHFLAEGRHTNPVLPHNSGYHAFAVRMGFHLPPQPH